MADWSELPVDVLGLFAERLLHIEAEDFVRFAAVCKSWRSGSTQVKKPRCSGPWLMISKLENEDPEDTGGVRTCYNLSTDRFFNLSLPQLQGRRCWGTKYGWLLTFGRDREIFLFDPLAQAKLSLPSQLRFSPPSTQYNDIKHFCRRFPGKFALSSDPSDSSHPPTILMAYSADACTSHYNLSFASPEDENWTVINNPTGIDDVIFFKGRFYCIGGGGVLFVCDMTNDSGPHTIEIACRPDDDYVFCGIAYSLYLVEISGDLYFISRCYDMDTDDNPDAVYAIDAVYATDAFYAYKFDFKENKWGPRCQHLQGHALFLGNNSSFAISPLDYPPFKPNCIYYTDDGFENCLNTSSDMGIYDYERDAFIPSFGDCTHKPTEFSKSFIFMPVLN